jgi:carbon monoxide dehydrogenase subunit G
MKVEHEITINRPVGDVFAYLSDPANLTAWQEGLHEVHREDEGAVHVGSRWTEKRTVMNRDMDASVEVVECDPDSRFTIESVSGSVRMRVEHDFSPSDAGTKVRLVGEGEAGGVMKLAGPMIKRQAKQMFEADLGRLKQLLER